MPNIPPLQCVECYKNSITFTAKDKKGLTTHLRLKHPNEYEDSKKVANIRIGWSNDEDKILANLEISLKAVQKGQILDRLTEEWNKIAAASHANLRSKDAIRGRRQQPEYKAILADLKSNLNNQGPDITDSLPIVIEPVSSMDTVTESDDVISVQNLMKEILTLHQNTLSKYMKDAINAFVNHNETEDPVKLTMLGIHQSINEYREKHTVNPQFKRTSFISRKKPARSKTRLEKAKKRAYYMNLYMHNKPRLLEELMDGVTPNTDPPPIHEAIKHYEKIWSTDVKDTQSVDQIPDVDINNKILLSPITKLDIEWAIKKTKKDTAIGIDLISLHEAKIMASEELYIAFNIWLGCKRIPSDLKLNRTTLIPKTNRDLHKITNWRPITISSILLRLFNKIIGHRLSRLFQIDKRQMGFREINGCSFNILWLHHLLKNARLNKRELYVCFIDVAKAFDSIPHESIYRALYRYRAPSAFIDLVRNQYTDSYTTLSYKNLNSKKIQISRGVKQGDSLSPILFNLVLDELLGILKDEFGYNIRDIGSSNIKCFADDICLISGSRIGMGEMLSKTIKFLEQRGLEVNANKCMSIGLQKAYKGKKSKITTEVAFNINGTPVPILGHVENYVKYLGIYFTSIGSININATKQKIQDILSKVCSISLKPHQKINLIRSHIIPLFIYQLINLEVYPKLLKQIDIIIRRTIRSILHLTRSLSIEFFYLPIREGGLQIPVLRDIVGLAKVRIYKNIMRSDDTFLKYLMETQGFHLIYKYMNDLKLDSSYESDDLKQKKVELMKDRRVSYSNKVHGYGFEIFSTCPITNRWLDGETRTMTGRTYINSIKLRTNSLATKVTLNRGLDVDKTCRKCKLQPESIMHVLQFCKNMKGLIYERHNRICSRVVNKLKERGYMVLVEKAYTVSTNDFRILRPDIIAIKEDHGYILDVQCVYESSGASFIFAENHKKEKYTPLIEIIKNEFNCPNVKILILTVGSRGSFYHKHLYCWYELGFTTSELRFVAISCMENSLRIMSTFHRSLTFDNSRDNSSDL
ncbi:unnamed protein product [Rotaria sp. Silwood2]|nr:unnamed protein product [Rotaria sp. Silwood2]CAF4542944.1 unnamed protein product [Rotaria sp. Silwood2]